MIQQPAATIEAAGTSPSDRTGAAGGLGRPFRAIVFDWDGTAVVDRKEDAGPLAALSESLLRYGVWLAVVTGTNFGNIDRQFVHLLAPAARPHLLVCTNRGSEVYGFDRSGATRRRYLRVATPQEDKQLSAIAEAVRDRLSARAGLEVRVIYDRLNRRKIDLIPLPEWADPPKAQIAALLRAVEQRLHQAGLASGIADAIALTQKIAKEQGLPGARITSDVKHIEVGLTDKRDSVLWLREHLLQRRKIALPDVLIGGDEFGPIAGFNGSDDLLRDGMSGATVVSVGAEPNGVPDGVAALSGGPARFRELLAEQLQFCQEAAAQADRRGGRTGRRVGTGPDWVGRALTVAPQPDWRLEADDPSPALEHAIESRFATVNGFLGVRASLEQPTNVSQPRTFVAGLYDVDDTQPPMQILIPAPDWLRLQPSVEGESLTPSDDGAGAGLRVLDLARGLLVHEWRLRRGAQQVCLRTLRFVSLVDRSIAVQAAAVTVEQPGTLSLEAWIEPPGKDLVPEGEEGGASVWRTAHGERRLALVVSAELAVDGRLIQAAAAQAGHRRWTWAAEPGRPAIFTRTVAFASRELESGAGALATAALYQAVRLGDGSLLEEHTRAWDARWAAGGVVVEGDAAAQEALRLAVYHLVGAADPDNEYVSIGARSLTGDAYAGHVFWDTEIFLLPFYILTWPEAARALLMYRFNTLPAARAKAARLGYRGAFYAWESADVGEEATPPFVLMPTGEVVPIRNGSEEVHISADVAYAVWQYWQATGDNGFLVDAGAEIVLETARFWASRASAGPDGRYHICNVIGPDEYHVGVDDDAYTNGMAQWNLERGVEVAESLGARWAERWQSLQSRLGLTADELSHWRDVAAHLVTGLQPGSDLIEQFGGFLGLESVDLAAYSNRTAPMDIVLGRERTQHAQVVKQADVIMLLALLWDRFPAEVREANFHYYEPRTGHGSSLDPAIHALVAARLGDVSLAGRYFRQAGEIDLDDTMGNAAQGVHIGAQGGIWQAAVLGFGGLSVETDGLRIEPHLPEQWSSLKFSVRWHGGTVRLNLHPTPLSLEATHTGGSPVVLSVGGLRRRLRRGETWACRRNPSDERWEEVQA